MTAPAHGRAPPALVLCRQCCEYVFDAEAACPHCGGDTRRAGARYLASGYAPIEAINRLDRVLERRGSN